MSKKFSLPSLKPASVADAAAGPVVVGATAGVAGAAGAEVVADAAPAEPSDNFVEASAEELGDVVAGLAAEATTTAPKESVVAPTQSASTAAPPASAGVPFNAAKLEELARDQVETRALVAAATARMEAVSTELRRRLDAAEAALRASADVLTGHGDTIRNTTALHTARLDHIDALLSSHGLPASAAATTKPRLRLRPTRTLTVPARVVADGVVLAYNPRPADDVELTVTQSGKPVFSGYLVEVPEGYVCDVFVGADAVSSLRGRGDGELLVKVSVRQGFRSIPGGSELCRLALRKVEAVELEVVQ